MNVDDDDDDDDDNWGKWKAAEDLQSSEAFDAWKLLKDAEPVEVQSDGEEARTFESLTARASLLRQKLTDSWLSREDVSSTGTHVQQPSSGSRSGGPKRPRGTSNRGGSFLEPGRAMVSQGGNEPR